MTDGMCAARGQRRPEQYPEYFRAIARKHAGDDGCLDTAEEQGAAAREIMQRIVRGINGAHRSMPRKPGLSQVGAERVSVVANDIAFDVQLHARMHSTGQGTDARRYYVLQITERSSGLSREVELEKYQGLGAVVQIATNGRDIFLRFDRCSNKDVYLVWKHDGGWQVVEAMRMYCGARTMHRAYFDVSQLSAAQLESGMLYLFGFYDTGAPEGRYTYHRE